LLLQDILAKLEKVKQLSNGEFQAQCPAHSDKNPSLTLRQAEDRVLLDCKAGCEPESIVSALKLTMSDLFTKTKPPIEPKIVATYDYNDEQGNLLYQVVRYEPKTFKQRRKDKSGKWVWDLKGTRRVLWRLPELLSEEGTIYLVEGEKDALKLWEWGQVATTSPGGAANWKPEYANYLSGKRVVLIPDKDEPGFNYARQAIKSLQGIAMEIKCIILPGDNVKDFSDWIVNNDIAALPLLEEDVSVLLNPELPRYKSEENKIIWRKNIDGEWLSFQAEAIRSERTGIHARISISHDYKTLAWSLLNLERSEDRTRLSNLAFTGLKLKDYTKEHLRRDLDLFCSGLWDEHLLTFTPELVTGTETIEPPSFYLFPYIIEGGGSILFAPPGRGKSITALLWAQSINSGISSIWKTQKAPVLFINLERSAKSVTSRLSYVNNVLGIATRSPLLILNARGKSLSDIAPTITKTIRQCSIRLIILDSMSRAGFGDLNENRPVNAIIDTLSSLCPTWVALGHTSRQSEEHLYGSIMADAGADIVIQLRTQSSANGTLGLGFEITKANDLPHYDQQILAFEFADWGLKAVRKAKPFEFSDIEAKKKPDMIQALVDYISNKDSADACSVELESALGYNRANISHALNNSPQFVKTRKDKLTQYFGLISHTIL